MAKLYWNLAQLEKIGYQQETSAERRLNAHSPRISRALTDLIVAMFDLKIITPLFCAVFLLFCVCRACVIPTEARKISIKITGPY